MKNEINGAPTTGDTVIDNDVMGIYPINNVDANSFISTVAIP